MAKKCPNCGGKKFFATAHVAQDWVVDTNGHFVETVRECSEIDHSPDDLDIWSCCNCGFSAAGKDFNYETTFELVAACPDCGRSIWKECSDGEFACSFCGKFAAPEEMTLKRKEKLKTQKQNQNNRRKTT